MTSDPPVSGRLRFDPVLTWGHILVALSVVISGVALYASNEVRYTDLAARMANMERDSSEYRADSKMTTQRLTDILVEISAIKATLPPAPRSTFPSR